MTADVCIPMKGINMAYGFYDDKSKAPVYTKDEADDLFVAIEGDEKYVIRTGLTWNELGEEYTWNELSGRTTADQRTLTEFLELIKPGGNTRVAIADLNDNFDMIDAALGPQATAPAAIFHRNNFRGKNLGTSVTQAQWDAIADQSFDDLWVGDYWVIGGVNWRIADINYWLNTGVTAFTTPHLVIVPDTGLYTAQMNDTKTTNGGYIGSKMYTTNLANAKTTVNSAFGSSHVLAHPGHFVNALSNGKPSGGAWVDSTVDLMNEIMVLGHTMLIPTSDGTTAPTVHTSDKLQFALFKMASEFINTREEYWLRDAISSVDFLTIDWRCEVHDRYADDDKWYVRPAFAIGTVPSA